VAVSPDGQRVAMAVGSYVHVLRLESGQIERSLIGHREFVNAVAWSADGRMLASASNDDTVRLWNPINGGLVRVLRGVKGDINAVSFSADGKRLASGGDDKLVRIWQVSSGLAGRVLVGSTSQVRGVAWRQDGRALAVASDDATIRVFDSATGKAIRTLPVASGGARAVAYSANGMLAAAGDDSVVRLWGAKSAVPRLLRGHSSVVLGLAFSVDARQLASVGFDRGVRVWNLRDGSSRQLLGHTDSVNSVAFVSRTGRSAQLITGGSDGKGGVWDLASGEQLAALSGFTSSSVALAWHPDSSRLASAANDTGLVVVAANAQTRTWQGHSGWVRDLKWSPDGQRLASVGDEGLLIIWDEDGQKRWSLRGEDGWYSSVSWSPDSVRVAVAGDRGVIGIWNAQSGALERELTGHSESILSLAWSPNGQFIVSGGSDSTVKLWRARDGAEVYALNEFADWTPSVVWSPDSTRFAVASDDGLISLWAAASGSRLETFRHGPGFVTGLAWSNDGLTLASGGDDGILRLWNTADGTALTFLKDHNDWVSGLAFSPDGTQLAVGTGTLNQGGTISVYGAPGGADVFGQVSMVTSVSGASSVSGDVAPNPTLAVTSFEIPSDFVALKAVGINARVEPSYRVTTFGDRLRLNRSEDDFTVVLRAIRVKGFDPTRLSLLELALERSRFECVFQTRAERCGDPVQIQALKSRFGLEGYQINLTAYDRERAVDRLTATPFTPVFVVDARRFAGQETAKSEPSASETVLVLIWLESRLPGAVVEQAEEKLTAFLEDFALEKPR
jgi:WD40 repeat protein